MDAEVLNKFRASFALDEKETLYGCKLAPLLPTWYAY